MDGPTSAHWYKPNTASKLHEEIRATLLRTPNYVASPHFLRTTSWVVSLAQDNLRNASLYTSTCFPISIIGIVSSQNLYMNPHGNFSMVPSSPNCQTTGIFAHAEYKFSLAPPVQFPSFMEDFERALHHIRTIYNPVKTPKGEYCWEVDTPFIHSALNGTTRLAEHQPVFNWSFPIFHRSVLITRDGARWDAYKEAIDSKYAELADEVREDFEVRHLPIYLNGGSHLKIEDYQSAMDGSLVEVQFGLENIYGQGLCANPYRVLIIEQGKKE